LTNGRLASPLVSVECRRCGHNSSSGARFCPDCGNALEPPVLAPARPNLGNASAAGSTQYGGISPLAGLPDKPPVVRAAPSEVSEPEPLEPEPLEPEAGRPIAHTLASIADELLRPAEGAGGRPASMRPVAPELNLPARETRCPECSTKNPSHSLYCAACGHGLGSDRPSRPTASPTGQVSGSHRAVLPAASAGAQNAYLAVITQDGLTGETHRLEHECTDIGRDEGAIRLSSDRSVCPRHARIVNRAGQYYLQDLGSVNGVYVRLRQPAALADGDLLLLGAEVLRFRLVSHAEQGLQAASERGTEVYGAPRLPRYACLYERTVEGVNRNVLYITRNETVIGRESGDIVFTADSFMSRRHAALRRDPVTGHFSLRDLGSSNGTYLAIRGEVPLSDGENVRVGQHLFRFGFGS
jgi:pSer/pThr/pTyr-binding forkhead associated (FHA) protein